MSGESEMFLTVSLKAHYELIDANARLTAQVESLNLDILRLNAQAEGISNELIEVVNDFVSMTSFHGAQYVAELDIPVTCCCEFCQLRFRAIELLNKVSGEQE